MIMKFLCKKTWEKYSGVGVCKIIKQMRKFDLKNQVKIVITEKWKIMHRIKNIINIHL